MANSHQRRTQKRAQQRAAKEQLWFILEHPLLASGAGAMLLAGIAIEISGWPMLATAFYLAALVLLIVVFVRADLFRVSPKKAWIILCVTTVLLIVFWVAIQPTPPPSASDLAKEIARELPSGATIPNSGSPVPTTSDPTPTSIEQARNELHDDSGRPLRDVRFGVKLNRKYSIQELGHFRIIYEVFSGDRLDFFLACQDLYEVNTFVSPTQMQFGYRCTTRYQKPDKQFTAIPLYTSKPKYTSLLSGKSAVDHISWQIDLYNQIPSYKTLEDLNRKQLYIFVSAPLVDKINEVSFQVNNWELVSVKFDALKFIADRPIAPWFLPLTATEKSIEWRGVYLKWEAIEEGNLELIGNDYVAVFPLDFSLIHPRKLPPPKFSVEPYP